MSEKTITQILGTLTGWVIAGMLILVTVGCQMNSKPDVINGADNIRYFHDSRTDLCFAAMNSAHESYRITSITNVPCTDKVQAIIHGE